MVSNPSYHYCEHNRMGDACEDCCYQRAKDAGSPVPPVSPAETREANEKKAAEAEAAVEDQPVIDTTASTGKVTGRRGK